jgi:DNA invertase Pin-like site-specific DNA recombinase
MIRFAIFVAVSSKPQAAEEKVSIPEQIKLCRQDGLKRKWKETAGPFIVPGETRTRWVNLRDAEEQIINKDGSHPLRDMLDAAKRKEYDVLIVYHYNRFRDLLDSVDKTLQAYGVQMTSHSQWTEPQSPDAYDPLLDIGKTVRYATGFASQAEIIEIRRRYKMGMPGRIRKGLHKGKLPYGYRKPRGKELDPEAIPVRDPVKSAIVIRIKDAFLGGQSLWQIAHALTKEKIPTPSGGTRWTDVITRHIMTNRFYCGEIQFGITYRSTDPRTGRVKFITNPASRVLTVQGKHPPLWDMKTQHRIDEEFKKRGRKYSGMRTQRLSNLLYCGICGARVYVAYTSSTTYDGPTDKNRRWRCKEQRQHVNLADDLLIKRVTDELKKTLKNANNLKLPQKAKLPLEDTHALIAELQTRKDRAYAAYESGTLSLEKYNERADQLDKEITDAQKKLYNSENEFIRQKENLEHIRGMAGIIEKIPTYITKAPAQVVNNHLRSFIQKIIITPDSTKIELIS